MGRLTRNATQTWLVLRAQIPAGFTFVGDGVERPRSIAAAPWSKWREGELASSVGGTGQPAIEGDEGNLEALSEGEVPRIVGDAAWRSAQTREAKVSNG